MFTHSYVMIYICTLQHIYVRKMLLDIKNTILSCVCYFSASLYSKPSVYQASEYHCVYLVQRNHGHGT